MYFTTTYIVKSGGLCTVRPPALLPSSLPLLSNPPRLVAPVTGSGWGRGKEGGREDM